MHQVGAVMHAQAVFGVRLQALGQVTGYLHDCDRQALQRGLDGGVPGRGVALGLVGLQHEEVGHRLDGDQAGLRAVEIRVFAERNGLGGQVRGQALALLLVVLGEQVLQERGQPLVGAVGGGHEGGQLGEFEEPTQGPQPGGAVLLEDEVNGEQQALEEGETFGGVEEGDEGGGSGGTPLTLPPVAEGGVGDAGRAGGVAPHGGTRPGILGVGEVACGLGAGVTKRRFRRGRGRVTVAGRHGSCLRLGCSQSHGRGASRVCSGEKRARAGMPWTRDQIRDSVRRYCSNP